MKTEYKRPRILDDFDAIKEELEINNLKELSSIMKPASKYLLIEKCNIQYQFLSVFY